MLEIKNLCLSYGKNQILKNINLQIKPHTVTAILGKNASGKSTLLSCLIGQHKYTGEISFSGKNLALMSNRERAQLISLLPQHLPKAEITAYRLLEMGRTPYLDFGKRLSQEDKKQIESAIAQADIGAIINKRLNEMSGGEKQLCYLAMILCQNTRLIAFDEPTTYMDIQNERQFIELLLKQVREKKKTALIVMHDISLALEIADNVIVLDGGEVKFHGTPDKIKQSGIIEEVFNVKRCQGEVYR